jgi:hypothetical protein
MYSETHMKRINISDEESAEFFVVQAGGKHDNHRRMLRPAADLCHVPKEDISETKPRADELMCDRGPVIMLSRRHAAAIGVCLCVISLHPVPETDIQPVVSLS